MEKKSLKVLMVAVFLTLSFIASNAFGDTTVLTAPDNDQGGATITCNQNPGNKAKCWRRYPTGVSLDCYWTGNQNDWC